MKKCIVCGNECHANRFPEVVFTHKSGPICEKCSIDFEEVDGVVQFRSDLASFLNSLEETPQ